MGARRALLRPACQAGRGRRDGPCGLIDLVVDDRKRALRQLAVVIAVECLHGQGLASRGFANALEIAFRDGEYDANRLYLADVHQRGGRPGAYQIAESDELQSRHAVDRGVDGRIFDI